ncbi:MAG: isoleucine--tRNA ligase [Candidatus Gottesmanbacteria bacterium]|nr:isoleucine--tRNA ligase [Candidatus Gottesmanbacteria bacterium]
MTSLKITNPQEKVDLAKLEHEVLDYWDETKAFEKSVSMRPENKRYVFYDGPPFATGLPHYGHILTSVIKDAIPRYWTMKGYRVDRVWGWDCHGIPIENMIEKELELKGGKKGIEEMGIDKFNAACRAAILRFDHEWEKIIRRIGRWVDFANSYKTMDLPYMESIWWAFKNLNDKGLLYEGRKIILYCPRCATPLSNFEIAMDNSYKDVEDHSVFVMFRVKGTENEYFVAWTTTPWTLIGNVGIAVDPKATYVKVSVGDKLIWVAEKRVAMVTQEENWEVKILEKVTGDKLVGREYEPLYPYLPLDGKKAFSVGAGDFVSLEEGTGMVHTAAIYGEDDYKFAQTLDLPLVPMLDDQGRYLDFVQPLSGIFFKKAEDWIVKDLIDRDLLLRAEKSVHSYPFCYRCETPLYYNAVPAWFINIQKMKADLVKQNENINWYPEHLKHGRFGKGLETAPDWNISRSRYWGTPMPVWRSQAEDSGLKTQDLRQTRIIGSLEELKKWAVNPEIVEGLTDIHREFLDDIEVWLDEGKTVKGRRIPEVFDCWVESGSMPHASLHYPFDHKELFEATHPSQFIVEYISQTRAWFYTLHVMSVGLFGTHTFENALTHGVILAEDGTKMSKSKKNFPDPTHLFEKYGVDALRFYLMESVVMRGENLNFSEAGVKDVYQNVISRLWNLASFYLLYRGQTSIPAQLPTATHVLDRWLIGLTESLVRNVSRNMDTYDTVAACRDVLVFLDHVSTWYLRRSRTRLREDPRAMEVYGWVLNRLVTVMAPMTPFISERIYQNLMNTSDSIHHVDWPSETQDVGLKTQELGEKMQLVREICALGHAQRKDAGVPVRQPVRQLQIANSKYQIEEEYIDLVKEELNVKEVEIVVGEGEFSVTVDTTSTPELVAEGHMRQLVRAIQILRKEKGCTIDAHIRVQVPEECKDLTQELVDRVKKETLSDELVWGNSLALLTGSTSSSS